MFLKELVAQHSEFETRNVLDRLLDFPHCCSFHDHIIVFHDHIIVAIWEPLPPTYP